jgi:hypothetical protein
MERIMPTKIKDVQPPRGMARRLYRQPRGWLLKGHFRAQAARLSPGETEGKVLAYARQHPRLVRYLPRLLGYRTDGSEEDLRALARLGIVVGFVPARVTVTWK